MEHEIKLVKKEIEAYKVLINSNNPRDGYYLERRSAKVWDTLEHWLKGYIPKEQYDELYSEWSSVVKDVYENKNLCIC